MHFRDRQRQRCMSEGDVKGMEAGREIVQIRRYRSGIGRYPIV
mgnify:CR=1 FL=1